MGVIDGRGREQKVQGTHVSLQEAEEDRSVKVITSIR